MENKEMKNENKTMSDKIRSSFTSRKFKGGAYAMVLSAIAIALFLVVNLLVTKMDIKIDVTDNGRYTLSDETIAFLKSIDEKITIYYLVPNGNEEAGYGIYFNRQFTKYDDYNSNIRIEYKDPVLHPKFASEYVNDEVKAMSFLVVNEETGRAKYVDNSELFTYSEDYYTYLYYYGQNIGPEGLNLEGKLNAAIQYVSNENLPVIYAVGGHGEQKFSTTMGTMLADGNVSVNQITLLTATEIPADCDILYVNQPTTDYTAEEIELMQKYMNAGGYAIFNVDYNTPDLPNLCGFLRDYGIEVHPGIVLDANPSNYNQQPYVLLPNVYNTPYTESVRGKKYVLAQMSSGMTITDDKRESVLVERVLYTSDKAYLKPLDATSFEKKAEDPSGTYYVTLVASEKKEENTAKLAVFSCKLFFADELLSASQYGNGEMLMNVINTFTEQENAVVVAPMKLAEETLTMTSLQVGAIAAVVCFGIPVIIIVIGIVVVVRRRKR